MLDRTRCVDKVSIGAQQRPERHQILVKRVVVGPLEAQHADVPDRLDNAFRDARVPFLRPPSDSGRHCATGQVAKNPQPAGVSWVGVDGLEPPTSSL